MHHTINTGVFLLLGTNLGDRNKNLANALEAIEATIGVIRQKSSVYETAAWGITDQSSFYNLVIEMETPLSSRETLQQVLLIEQKIGRKRNEKWGERIIDIDILLFGNETIETKDLVIPHPQLANRKFTLVPLNEIAPHKIHPKLQRTINELLTSCPDTLAVQKMEHNGM